MAPGHRHGPTLPMRRALLAAGLALPFTAPRAAASAGGRTHERILVVLEMSGGNDVNHEASGC